MTVMLVFCWILWFITLFVQGFNFWTILALISVGLFSARKIGYFSKFTHHVALEGFGGFLTVIFQLIFKSFVLKEFLIVLAIRAIFILVILYDKKCYVYVTEKRRKDKK